MRNEILELSLEFAIEIVKYCELLEEKRKFAISNQLIRSGTSIWANVREAQNPHSRADFVSKLTVAAKEASETEYWLLLCEKNESYPNPNELMDSVKSIQKLLSKIISTSKIRLLYNGVTASQYHNIK